MEKRMLNTHPELFNSDYEVEFPFDDDQIVKRSDYKDIPVSKYKSSFKVKKSFWYLKIFRWWNEFGWTPILECFKITIGRIR